MYNIEQNRLLGCVFMLYSINSLLAHLDIFQRSPLFMKTSSQLCFQYSFHAKIKQRAKSVQRFLQVSKREDTDEYDYHIPIVPIHPDLEDVVIKHADSLESYLKNKPIAAHTKEAYQVASKFVRNFYAEESCFDPSECKVTGELPVILDSGCGTGTSSISLADDNPLVPVIGVDRSLARLSKNRDFRDQESERIPRRKNLLLLRGELGDFWRLVDKNKEWRIVNHHILYPNPYVKAKQLKSRFHGHPIFPIILKIGGEITVRSNWKTYVDEFAKAIELFDDYLGPVQENMAQKYRRSAEKGSTIFSTNKAITNFEKKYIEAKETLYEIVLKEE